MTNIELTTAIIAGILQGIVEWLPVSSQGNIALFLTVVNFPPQMALQLALFLQIGTTLSAVSYYREDIIDALHILPTWRPQNAFEPTNALISFILLASVVTGIVGIPLYIYAVDFAEQLSGGIFIVLIGLLLIFTGAIQLFSDSIGQGFREQPTMFDACIVGAVQGLAILPGVSRSGMTTSALLFRSYDPPVVFQLSFLLAIPASIGAAGLTIAGAGGLPGITPVAALTATVTSAVVGYFTIDALLRVVERIPFWSVCFGLGGIAILGGVVVTILT